MTWPGGQLVKQYTLLLIHHAELSRARAARARSRPAPASKPSSRQGLGGSEAIRAGQVGRDPLADREEAQPRGITTRQMAMALLRAQSRRPLSMAM